MKKKQEKNYIRKEINMYYQSLYDYEKQTNRNNQPNGNIKPEQYDVYWCKMKYHNDETIANTRPVIIVSNNWNNANANTLNVIPCTTKEKKPLPCHVTLQDNTIALTEQITTISKADILEYKDTLNWRDVRNLKIAMQIQFGTL